MEEPLTPGEREELYELRQKLARARKIVDAVSPSMSARSSNVKALSATERRQLLVQIQKLQEENRSLQGLIRGMGGPKLGPTATAVAAVAASTDDLQTQKRMKALKLKNKLLTAEIRKLTVTKRGRQTSLQKLVKAEDACKQLRVTVASRDQEIERLKKTVSRQQRALTKNSEVEAGKAAVRELREWEEAQSVLPQLHEAGIM